MKYIGVLMIIICTTSVGFMLRNELNNKIKLCDEIITFCNNSLIEIGFYQQPIINDYLKCVREGKSIKTNLSKDDNDKLNVFFKLFGSSNIENETAKIGNLRDYFVNRKKEYENIYLSKSKIYVSLSFCLGVVISILIV